MNASLPAAVITERRGSPEKNISRPRELMPKLMQHLGLREHLCEAEVIDAWSKIVDGIHGRTIRPRNQNKLLGDKTIRDVHFRVGQAEERLLAGYFTRTSSFC